MTETTPRVKIDAPVIRKGGERRWEAVFLTNQVTTNDVDDGVGHRRVVVSAAHDGGVYTVRAFIDTFIQKDGHGVAIGRVFKDPLVSLSAYRARFSQKRLLEIFNEALDDFDVDRFYVLHEVDF